MFHQSNTCDIRSCDIQIAEPLSNWQQSLSTEDLNSLDYDREHIKVFSANSCQASSVCRICLATNCKMFSISRSGLKEMLNSLLGSNMSIDLFSPTICWECRARLVSANQLRNKARRSQVILMEILHTVQEIKPETVKHVDRRKHGLNTTLGTIQPKTIDIHPVKEEAQIIKQESVEAADENIENRDALIMEDSHIWPEANTDVTPYLDLVKKEKKPSEVKKKSKAAAEKSKKMARKKKETPTGKKVVQRADRKARAETDKLLSTNFTIRKLSPTEQREDFEKRKEQEKYLSKDYKCTVCYTAFTEEPKYKEHLLQHDEVWGKHECQICYKRTKSKYHLHSHVRDCHLAEYTCRECNMITMNRSTAISHLKGHSGTKFKCPLCPAEFSYRSTYMNHRRIKHVSEYVCGLCGYTFINETGINMHKKKTHRLDGAVLSGPYCETCDVKFVSEEAYTKHLALSSKHSSDATRKEIRNDCSSKARLGADKSNGTRGYIAKMPITCEVCGKVVMGLVAYAHHFSKQHPSHKRVQFPSKQPAKFMCDQCGKQFQKYTFLENHLPVHTGVKTFQCDICLKKFMTKFTLTMHVRRHSGNVKKYQCPECGRDFTDKSNFSRHRLIHTELKKYECSFCGKTFKWGESLRAHVKHVHLKVPWPKRDRGPRRQTEY